MIKRIQIHIKHILLIAILSWPLITVAQTGLPDVDITDIDGKQYNLVDLVNTDKVTAVIFWATWCKPCIEELDNIADYYLEWMEEVEFNLVSVCIDDSRTYSSVKGFIRGREWPFPVLTDKNQDLKRAMNVTDIPYYCLFDKEGNILVRHTGYLPGDEDIMFDKIIAADNEN